MVFKQIGNSGFSILSVLVATGILGVLLAGFASVLADQSKNQAFIEQKMMVSEHHMEVREYLRDSANCTASFLGQDPVKTDQGVVTDLKKTLLDGTLSGHAEVGSGSNRGYKIVSYELSDQDPDVSVAGEGTTHFITQYKTNSGREVFRVAKLFVRLDTNNLIQSCSISSKNAAGKNSNIPGVTPTGTCVVRGYNISRAAGGGGVAGNDDEPKVDPVQVGNNGKNRTIKIWCPKNFPLAVTGSVSPSCSVGELYDGLIYDQSGLSIGATCIIRFLEDRNDLTPAEITSHKNACNSSGKTFRDGTCHITCCNL